MRSFMLIREGALTPPIHTPPPPPPHKAGVPAFMISGLGENGFIPLLQDSFTDFMEYVAALSLVLKARVQQKLH